MTEPVPDTPAAAPDPEADAAFLAAAHPWDILSRERLEAIARQMGRRRLAPGETLYDVGETLDFVAVLRAGGAERLDARGATVAELAPGATLSRRGALRGEPTRTALRATQPSEALTLEGAEFRALCRDVPAFGRFFSAGPPRAAARSDLASLAVSALMTATPETCPPETPAREAAARMHARGISSLCVATDGQLLGLLTLRDLTGRLLAEGRAPETPVGEIMTAAPIALPPSALGSDVLSLMMERRVGHVPVVEGGRLVGIVTQTDLTRAQALGAGELVRGVAEAPDADAMARVTERLPELLAQLVAAGARPEAVTRQITDVADAATRRLLALAEDRLGPPPVPYLWLACGSQGRQEQTGVSDQDNCLMLSDAVTDADMPYFERLARFVSDGLATCGYVYCPGDMMATNPRWRQPVHVWRDYFAGWIAHPSPEAQMLASVMFDLRPIGGDASLFEGLHRETLEAASRNSIFTAHMVSNSLKHAPPLGLLRGFATIRSGEHRHQIDLKLNGVVPVVDLARVYALMGRIEDAGTRARLTAASAAGVVSEAGGRDLIDAWDLIAATRLGHQARRIARGAAPDNYMAPSELSEFERSHLREAFVVVRTMQSALGHGKGALS
jgi:CBS domain-containing protein